MNTVECVRRHWGTDMHC